MMLRFIDIDDVTKSHIDKIPHFCRVVFVQEKVHHIRDDPSWFDFVLLSLIHIQTEL